jgi:hypothetical protein
MAFLKTHRKLLLEQGHKKFRKKARRHSLAGGENGWEEFCVFKYSSTRTRTRVLEYVHSYSSTHVPVSGAAGRRRSPPADVSAKVFTPTTALSDF